jgi:hypothetical protein
MLQIKVVLVDTTGTVKPDTMAAAAEALNVQVTRDLPEYWKNVNATVSYRPDAKSIPQGMWPVQLVKTLPPDEGGFHMTKHNQPYAKVIVTPNSDEWTIDASHETVEMLVDPYGNRLQTSNAIDVAKGRITAADGKYEYLVEACDPCEANKYAYSIDGTMVSDFITPSFYDPDVTANARYSFTGAVKSPREILPGGYISWVDPKTSEMKQILWVDPSGKPQLRDLGPAPKDLSLREFVESKTFHLAYEKRVSPPKATLSARKRFRATLQEVAAVRARHYV